MCWAHRTGSIQPAQHMHVYMTNNSSIARHTISHMYTYMYVCLYNVHCTFTKASYMSVKKLRIVSLPRDWPSWSNKKRMSDYRGQGVAEHTHNTQSKLDAWLMYYMYIM